MNAIQPHRLLLAALVAAGIATGCTLELPKVDPAQQQKPGPEGGMQDPSLDALRVIDDALAAARQFDLRMPPPPTAPSAPPPGGVAMAPTGPTPTTMYCDAQPDVTLAMVCGMDQVVTAHVAWSGCQLPPPPQPEGSQQQQPPADQVVTSGVLDTETTVTETVCNPVTQVTFTRHTAFSLTKTSAKGEVTTSGGVDSAGTQKLAPGGFTRTMALDVTSSAAATDGTRKEFALQGDLTLTVAMEPGKPPVTAVDGSLSRIGDSPETYAVKQVERGDPKACRWPMKGEISRTLPDGQKHVMIFGPECGQATVDGKQVSLNPPPPDGQQPPPPQE